MLSGAMAKLLAGLLAATALPLDAEQIMNISLVDKLRNRTVTSTVCFGSSGSKQDLYIFAHGGGLYAGDYEYLCAGGFPGTVARLVSPASDDPMDLTVMAKDLIFLAAALPVQSSTNLSSPLHGRLTSTVVLAGHSMGGAAAILAGSEAPESVKAVMSIAPGFWGPEQTKLLQGVSDKIDSRLCDMPYVQLAGDQDCANSLDLQARSIWLNVSHHCADRVPRALGVLAGATHCQWTTPVVGSCPFDKPCPVPHLEREEQQQLGMYLLAALGQGHIFAELRSLNSSQIALVDQDSPAADLGKLKSLCPCGSELIV